VAATLEVEPGGATASMIDEAWADVLSEIGTAGSAARELVAAHGADPDAMAAASVTVEQKENDFGATLLVTVVGAVTVHVLESLWDDFVRPRLRRRFKRDASRTSA
jgi:hypothetical protein